MNLSNIINTDAEASPCQNYDILKNILNNLFDKYMPYRQVRFNKYKHKKSEWMTNGILKSLKFRDNLYKIVKCTDESNPNFDILKQNLKSYKCILRQGGQRPQQTSGACFIRKSGGICMVGSIDMRIRL